MCASILVAIFIASFIFILHAGVLRAKVAAPSVEEKRVFRPTTSCKKLNSASLLARGDSLLIQGMFRF